MTRLRVARKFLFFGINWKQATNVGRLINVLKAANQEVPDDLMKFGTTVKRKGHDAYGAFYKDVDSTKTATKITFD